MIIGAATAKTTTVATRRKTTTAYRTGNSREASERRFIFYLSCGSSVKQDITKPGKEQGKNGYGNRGGDSRRQRSALWWYQSTTDGLN
jgi:hypothetical protein